MSDKTYKRIIFILYMILIGIVFYCVVACSKYQVVQKIDVNLYHLHNPKTNEIEIVVTKQDLQIGKFYKLNQIDVIETTK